MPSNAYPVIARSYDQIIGLPFFRGWRAGLERLVRRYGIRFRSAADLGCGTGLFAVYLNRHYRVPVFAIDRSLAMLRVALKRDETTPRAPGLPQIQFLHQDIRSFELSRTVDLVTASHDTVNHLLKPADLRLLLRNFALHLADRGHFIFDVRAPAALGRGCRCFRRRTHDGCLVVQTVRTTEGPGRFETVVVRHCRSSRQPSVRNTERVWTLDAMRSALGEAGLDMKGLHDATTLGPAKPRSGRIIVVAAPASSDTVTTERFER